MAFLGSPSSWPLDLALDQQPLLLLLLPLGGCSAALAAVSSWQV
jgi:hypothetical protein